VFPSGWFTASCDVSNHEAPAEGCECGLRGMTSVREFVAGPRTFPDALAGRADAIGLVELGGRMVGPDPVELGQPHTSTVLRAERARVIGPVLLAEGLGHHARWNRSPAACGGRSLSMASGRLPDDAGYRGCG